MSNKIENIYWLTVPRLMECVLPHLQENVSMVISTAYDGEFLTTYTLNVAGVAVSACTSNESRVGGQEFIDLVNSFVVEE